LGKGLDFDKFIKGIVAFALVIFLLFGTLIMAGVVPSPFGVGPTDDTTDDTTQDQYSINCLSKVTFKDKFGGSGVASATVVIYYYTSKEQKDTGTTAATTGIFTSNVAFRSGDKYWVKITGTGGSDFHYFLWTVPYEDTDTVTYHYSTLEYYTIGAYAITAQAPNGTVLADGYDFNMSGLSYPTLILMIRETSTSDRGVMNFEDPFKSDDYPGVNRELLLLMKASGTSYESLVPMGDWASIVYTSSSYKYYGIKIDPNWLVRDKEADNTYKQYQGEDMDGVYTLNIQLDVTGLSSPAISCEFFLYAYSNLERFGTYGTHWSDAYELQATDYDIDIVT